VTSAYLYGFSHKMMDDGKRGHLGPSKVALKRSPKKDGGAHLLTPDLKQPNRLVDALCDTPRIIGGDANEAVEFGLVARTVPQGGGCPVLTPLLPVEYNHIRPCEVPTGSPYPVSDGSEEACADEEEPVTPRGAMLPRVAPNPPAVKNVNPLSPNWQMRDNMFDEGYILSPMKTISSPGDVSSLWSGTSRLE
jgi:hypothetical protein